MEVRGLYKLMPIPSLAEALAKRSRNIIAERQEKRRECFWGSRIDLSHSPITVPEKKKPSRAEMLKKWKAEKLKRLEEEKKKQKPIFKVGIVHRKITGSPVIAQPVSLKKPLVAQKCIKKPQTSNSDVGTTQILTRAKARNMGVNVADVNKDGSNKPQMKFNNKFYRIEGGKKKNIDTHVFKVPGAVSKLPCQGLTYPSSPKLLRRKERARQADAKVTEGIWNMKAKPAKGGKYLEETVTGEHKKENAIMECTKEKATEEGLVEVITEPHLVEEVTEPHLVEKVTEQHMEDVARESIPNEVNVQKVPTPEKGTEEDGYVPIVYSPFVTVRSGRKSKRKSRKTLTMDVEEQIKKEESEFKCRIFSFRKYIECEKKRLLETCDKWKHIYQEFEEVPTEIEGDIDSVVGKTNLLTSDKFMQFERLIDKCENGDPFVKPDDLQGFQDWVSIEVERIDEEFHKLEKLKRNNWKPESVIVDVNKVHKVKVSKKLQKKPVGSSSIRSHILAARKLLKEGKANDAKDSILQKAAFERTVTPKKSGSLLKDVLNSETKKKNESSNKKSPMVRERRNSGLEIMIATQKNKFPTPVKKSPLLSDFEISIGKGETPRSILKKTTSSSKGHVSFKKQTENLGTRVRSLSERYFQPCNASDDDSSPVRTVLGNLGNVTPSGMMTRSRNYNQRIVF